MVTLAEIQDKKPICVLLESKKQGGWVLVAKARPYGQHGLVFTRVDDWDPTRFPIEEGNEKAHLAEAIREASKYCGEVKVVGPEQRSVPKRKLGSNELRKLGLTGLARRIETRTPKKLFGFLPASVVRKIVI